MNITQTNVPDIIWPGIPTTQSAVLSGVLFQLGQSEWLKAETLEKLQFQQIDLLASHARRTVPYYQDSFARASIPENQSFSPEGWGGVPLLSRDDMMNCYQDLHSDALPKAHGEKVFRKTSGSSGNPLRITDSQLHQIFFHCNTLRFSLWQQRDLFGRIVEIRSGRSSDKPLEIKKNPSWGFPHALLYKTGPAMRFYQRMPIEQQAREMLNNPPSYLLAYPSNVTRLAQYFAENGLDLPELKQISTYGETVLPETEQLCRDTWGVGTADMYSSEEVGYIALQCPQSDNYHCMSESVLVEVLDENGNACQPGEIGRVVLTVLHNFAMPMIRYENLDYAEVGPPCECGRGLPVIKRIMGRKRNMAQAVDGSRFWPELDPAIWSGDLYCDSLQLVQDANDHIEVKIVSERPLEPSREHELTQALGQALGQPYRFSVSYQQEALRHANGKYERFICKL
jgi:phenylacetate-CoA ligase